MELTGIDLDKKRGKGIDIPLPLFLRYMKSIEPVQLVIHHLLIQRFDGYCFQD